jgi:putative transport protein
LSCFGIPGKSGANAVARGTQLKTDGVAHAVCIVTLVAAVGLTVGQVKVQGIGLGISGVLFVGLAAAHFGLGINHDVLEFLRDTGLILFVFTIGLHVVRIGSD